MKFRAAPLVLGASLMLLIALPVDAIAQSRLLLQIAPPDIEQFPLVELRLAVTDELGRPVTGLTTDAFEVFEDELPVEQFTLSETGVGSVQTYLINTDPGLRVRDSRGRSRFDFLRAALIDAWQLPEASRSGADDLTLLIADGPLVEHSKTAAELAATLNAAQPSFEDQASGYDLLLNALEYVGPNDPELASVSNLVFATALLPGPRDIPIPDIVARARARRALLHTILIGAEELLDTPEAENLRQLAEESGGEFIVFDPEVGLASLIQRMLAQRTQYLLSFSSQIAFSGDHQIRVRVDTGSLQAESGALDFRVDLQAPEVAFVDPPAEIVRESDDLNLTLDQIPPTSHDLQILITFPDGYERPLTGSQLLVDGEVMQSREVPPFHQFEWDLSGYAETGLHTLRVDVTDGFGMQASSVDVPVLVSIARPPGGLAALRPALGSLLTALGVLIAGVILAVALLSRGTRRRLRPGSAANQRVNPMDRIALRRRGPAEAFLIPLQPAGDPIDLTGEDVIIGSDASLAAVFVDDASVGGVHARLIRQADGSYLVRDQGSVAGTWVNFELVPEDGRLLRQGDRLQLGRVEFRFRLPGDAPTREIRVTPQGAESET